MRIVKSQLKKEAFGPKIKNFCLFICMVVEYFYLIFVCMIVCLELVSALINLELHWY